MSNGKAYEAITDHLGMCQIIVNCDADKLVITKLDHSFSSIDSCLSQFHIYWSNVSKFSVDHLKRGASYSAAGEPNTRTYHFEFIDQAQLSPQFRSIVGRKFSFSITDRREGFSLLLDAINLGCMDRMHQKGDCRWEILEDDSEDEEDPDDSVECSISNVFNGPKVTVGRTVRASGSSRDRRHTQQSIQSNAPYGIYFYAGNHEDQLR